MNKDLLAGKKVAIVDDWLTNLGGTTRVIEALAEAFPDAPIYTSLYNEKALPQFAGRVRTSFLQRWVPQFLQKKHQYFLHLMPRAFASLDLSEFDIIISSSSAFSKNITKRDDQLHVCYCHTPVRYLYFEREKYLKGYPLPWYLRPMKMVIPKILDFLTTVDQKSVAKVDGFIANSNYVKDRIQKYYGRDATVIYPPVDTGRFRKALEYKAGGYFYAHGRVVPYKRVDLLVDTFIKNKLPLKVSGTGPDLEKCRQKAFKAGARNIDFLGFVPEKAVPELYGKARCFLFPPEEDFGITPVEALAAGTPVIYYDKGGASESIGKYGIPFEAQTVESLQKAIDVFLKQEKDIDHHALQDRAGEFSIAVFQKNIKEYIIKQLDTKTR